MHIENFFKVIGEEIAAQREQLFLWTPVAAGAGIGVYFALPFEPALWVGLVALAAAFAGLVAAWRHPAKYGLILLFIAVLGFVSAQVRTITVYTPILKKETGPVQVSGTIDSVEALEDARGVRLLLYDLDIEKLSREQTPMRARLSARKNDGFVAGQRVTLLADLNPPAPPVEPGAFDFQRSMFFQSIGAVGFIYKKIGDEGAPQNDFGDYIEGLRNIIAARMAAVIGKDAAPMSIAFITGQRAAISQADNDAMRYAGLFHLISISGVHIGLFSAIVFFTVRFLLACIPGWALRYPIKKFAAVPAFLAAAFYTVLAGASAPTVRSLVMTGIAYIAIMLDRSPLSLRLLAFGALLVLLAAPESLTGASFQMSFAAVAALIIFFDWLRPWWSAWSGRAGVVAKFGLYVAGVCLTTIIATLATAPFSVFNFQQLSLYGLPANAVAVPITSFIIMPAIILSLFLMPLHLEFLPLKALEFGMEMVLWVARHIAALPYSSVGIPAWPVGGFILMVCALIYIMLWKSRLRWLGVAPLMASLIVIFNYHQPDILVSSDYKVAAYRPVDGSMSVSQKRSDRFEIESWERIAGLEPGEASLWPKEGQDGAMSCDGAACRLEMRGHRVSFLKTPEDLAQECAWAELVIAVPSLDLKKDGRGICGAVPVRDKWFGWREGGQAVWLEPRGVRIETVEDVRGRRPWSRLNDRSASGRRGVPVPARG